MGITLVIWSRAGSNGRGCAEQQAIIGRNKGARVKEEVGNDAGDICLRREPSPAHSGRGLTVLGHSLVISTLLLSARLWQGMEDEGKIGRLIEIIIRRTSVTVVSRVAQCLSHAGRCVSSR